MTIRTINLIIDVSRGVRVDSTGNLSKDKLRMVRGDDIQINVDAVTVGGDLTIISYPFETGTAFRLVAKKAGEYGGPELVLADADTWNVAGHRADLDLEAGKLSCRFKLNRKALLDALGTATPSVPVVMDIEAVTIDGQVSTLIQLSDAVLNDAARNDDQVDASTADYLTLEALRAEIRAVTHPDGGFYKIDGGRLYLWDVDHGDFAPVALSNNGFVVMEDA